MFSSVHVQVLSVHGFIHILFKKLQLHFQELEGDKQRLQDKTTRLTESAKHTEAKVSNATSCRKISSG